jgi:hypothetical protein
MMQMIDTPAARQFVPNSDDTLQTEPPPVAPIYHITHSIVVVRGQKILRASLRSQIATPRNARGQHHAGSARELR